MGKTKPTASKKSKRVLDFKKIKRKIGRKLPPPKNFTNTSIKSKVIVLPEQSVATEKTGLVVNKKGLTLRELLQQTSHHNGKIRRAALLGIRDLVSKHPLELQIHKLSLIEKLRERICDSDKVVRETLYQLLKTAIFPSLKADIISLLMAYVFNAMTHIVVDIRLMAFKFLELVVLNYPSSFTQHTELVLDNYTDILKNYQIYLLEKSHLKNVLGGLVHCLSLLVKKSGEKYFNEPNVDQRRCLFSYASESPIVGEEFFSATKWLGDLVPVLVGCFHESYFPVCSLSSIDAVSFDCLLLTVRCINLSVSIIVENINKFHAMPDGGPYGTLVFLKTLYETFPLGQLHHSTAKDDERYFVLNAKIAETFLHLLPWINESSFPIEKLLGFIESSLLGEVGCNSSSTKALLKNNLCLFLPFIPRLISQATASWRIPLLKAFTVAFRDCKVDSQICMSYLGSIEAMLLPATSCSIPLCNHPEMFDFQVEWLHELPKIICCIGDKRTDISKAILKLLVSVGKSFAPNSSLALEYDHLQCNFIGFYSRKIDDAIIYGPFINLTVDCQELAIGCLYYFSSLGIDLLNALAFCCLNPALDVFVVARIVEILYSAYRAGHVLISHMIGFLFTLVARFKVYPNRFGIECGDGSISNRRAFKLLTGRVSSCLSSMGDNSLVWRLLQKNISNEISQTPSLDNTHGLLKVIITLDVEHSLLSCESSITMISKWIFQYITSVNCYIPNNQVEVDVLSNQFRIFKYYVWPCIILFHRNDKLLLHVLELFSLALMEDKISVQSPLCFDFFLELFTKIHAVSSILLLMLNEKRCYGCLSLCKDAIKKAMHNLRILQNTTIISLTHEEKHKLQLICDRLDAKFLHAMFKRGW